MGEGWTPNTPNLRPDQRMGMPSQGTLGGGLRTSLPTWRWAWERLSAYCEHISLRTRPESGGLAKEAVDHGGGLDAKHTQPTAGSAHGHAQRSHWWHFWPWIAQSIWYLAGAGLGFHFLASFGRRLVVQYFATGQQSRSEEEEGGGACWFHGCWLG